MLDSASLEKMRVGKLSISTSLLVRAARQKGYACTFLPEKVVLISNGKISHFFKGTSLPCNNTVAAKLSCNKYFLRKLLREKNIPAPRTIALRHPAAWRSVLTSSLRFPLVVKPINASHANGASLNITTPGELRRAVERAFAFMRKNKGGDRVLVEEFFASHDLRLLVIGNKAVSVLRREPAYVVGNGSNTIRELIHAFNRQWRSSIKYDFPLCPMPIDSEVTRYLTKKDLDLNSILPAGEKTHLRWNANVSTGGRAIDVSDQVHPRIKALAVQIARISQLKIGGVDLLCKNPASADISAVNIAVLEINDSPGLDIHHFPFQGKGRNVASDILTYIFGKTTRPQPAEKRRLEALLANIHITAPASSAEAASIVAPQKPKT